MHGLAGCFELVEQTELTAVQRDFLSTGRACVDMLTTVVSDILDLSKLEMGKMTLERRPFSLAAVVDNTLLIVKPKVCKCTRVCEFVCRPRALLTCLRVPGNVPLQSRPDMRKGCRCT